jgi:DNA 3'-phosphatase
MTASGRIGAQSWGSWAKRLVLSVSFMGGLLAACTSDPGSDVQDHTGCEGARVDDGGICRKPSGQFAKKVCCAEPEVAAFPSTRQSLEAYACAGDGEDVKVAFFDADSTLRVSRGGSPTANAKDDVYILPFVASKIASLQSEGYLVAIVSNQGGVAAGFTPIEVAEGALVFVAEQLDRLGAKINYLDFAEAKDAFRKPETGMAELLDEVLNDKCGVRINYDESFMVGDAGYKKDADGPHPDGRPADDFSNSDRGFAENLGIPFTEPTDYFGWRTWEVYNIHAKSELVAFLDAIDTEIADLEAIGEEAARVDMLRREVSSNRMINEL